LPRAPDPALARIDEPARSFWLDATARRSAIETLYGHWYFGRADDAAAEAAAVDHAVVTGMRALGFGREPVTVEVVSQSRGEHGAKTPHCVLRLSGRYIRDMAIDRRSPDTIVRTWVHESIHARLPFDATFFDEWERWKGYEEGLAEGLARLATRRKAGMRPLTFSYHGYVTAYVALARAAGVTTEQLLRAAYRYPNGAIRERFPEMLEALRGHALDHARVRTVADELFASARSDADVRFSEAVRRWRSELG
jgi:hypothetical protein